MMINEGYTGFCHRCGDVLVGRQIKWCSQACRRDHETEQTLIDDILVYTRRCKTCGLTKPLAVDFYKLPTGTFRRNCRACVMEGNKTRHELAPEKKRASHLKGLYNLTIDEYEQIFVAQGGVCAICKKPPTKQRLAVDHDHRSKVIRGLLCTWCNLHVVSKLTDAAVLYSAGQ